MSDARKDKSYEEFYGQDCDRMKKLRSIQCKGTGNPNSKKYIIHNIKFNKYWYTHGNLNSFCQKNKVSPRTMLLSRKDNLFINYWKCSVFNINDEFHLKIKKENSF